MNYSVRNIVVAVLLAVCAAVAVVVYTSNVKQRAEADQERVKVYVAAKDIEPGTTGEQVLADKLLVQREVVRSDQAPGALTSLAGLQSKVVSQKIYAETQVIAPVFAEPALVDDSLNLTGNMRAIQVPMDLNASLQGSLAAGDRVDILEGIEVTNENGAVTPVVRRLLRNVLVLRVPDEKDSRLSSADDKRGIMLAVTDLEATRSSGARRTPRSGSSSARRPRRPSRRSRSRPSRRWCSTASTASRRTRCPAI